MLLVNVFLYEWGNLALKMDQRHPVMARDRYRCTVPGCTVKVSLDGHHLVYQSRGGSDEEWNLTTLCRFHHQQGVHGGAIRAQGTAPGGIVWALGLRPDGQPTEVFLGDQRVYG
jgi:hypothetical protein